MDALHYIGFDVHKKSISFCVKTAAGEIVEEGSVPAQRAVLRRWAAARQQPWRGAMEATLFSAWIYDTLKPYGQQLAMAHPAKMKAISAGKKKSDTSMLARSPIWCAATCCRPAMCLRRGYENCDACCVIGTWW